MTTKCEKLVKNWNLNLTKFKEVPHIINLYLIDYKKEKRLQPIINTKDNSLKLLFVDVFNKMIIENNRLKHISDAEIEAALIRFLFKWK